MLLVVDGIVRLKRTRSRISPIFTHDHDRRSTKLLKVRFSLFPFRFFGLTVNKTLTVTLPPQKTVTTRPYSSVTNVFF